MKKKEVKEKKIVFDTELVDHYTEQIHDGVILKRFQNPWLKGEIGLRRSGLVFQMSKEEQEEYVKCALDIHYFTEKYCKVKTEDGTVNNIKLRKYQKEVLNDFVAKRFNILCASRQVGKTIMTSIFMIHTILFKNDKNIMIIANKGDTANEIVEKIKAIYILLPFFLKPGIKVWNQKSLTFDNGCKIKTSARSKTPAIGFTIDILYMDEFAHIPSTIIEPYYTAAYPTVSGIDNSKIIITSTPNGMNLFHKLLVNGERLPGDPLKNRYNAKRVYWYEVDGRFVTFIRLDPYKLKQHGLEKELVLSKIEQEFGSKTKVNLKWDNDIERDVISVFNNDDVSDDIIRTFTFLHNDREINILELGELTTWKDEAIKDIGSLDAFNQEYGLRFINGSRSLLNENIINELLNKKKEYEFIEIDKFSDKLRFNYEDLKWVRDEETFKIESVKDYKVVLSIDISEGLGQDYSIINIFKMDLKSKELIEKQKQSCSSIVDFFCLEQIGTFRNNYISIKQLSELLYLICFELLDPENTKVVLELNNYGGTLLAEMPNVFDGNNEYGSDIFLRYKHRVDATEEKIGLKIGESSKKILIKEYQDLMTRKSFSITNPDNINEITTFVKHTTTAGNIRYAADGSAHDDLVMTVVNACSSFQKVQFKEMAEEWIEKFASTEMKNYINECMEESEYIESVDYKQVLDVKNRSGLINKSNRYTRGNGYRGDGYGRRGYRN
jgi:hypothetical protein|tara:strand:+ start:53517 stop:55685 length:2169 start_codon:yes stop_codon:yes gene_type:complete